MNRLSCRLFFASIVSGFGAICFAPPAGAQSFTGDEPLEVFGLKSAQPQELPPVVTALAINADGSILATAGDDHMVNLWRIDDGKLAHQLLGHGDWVRAVQFSPDGKLLASAGDDRGIRLWNPATGELVRKFARHATSIYALDFSPDGKTIAAAGFENVVRIYDLATGHFVRALEMSLQRLAGRRFFPRRKPISRRRPRRPRAHLERCRRHGRTGLGSARPSDSRDWHFHPTAINWLRPEKIGTSMFGMSPRHKSGPSSMAAAER